MKSLAILLAGSALAVAAHADTKSFSFSNPFQTTEINQTGNLGLFDSSLGTLTSVKLTFTGGNSTNLSLTNNAANSQTTRATSTTDLFFSSSLAALNGKLTAANPVVSLSETTGFVTLAAGATQAFGPLTDSKVIDFTTQANTILSSFIGSGNFGVSCTSISGIAIQGGGGNIASTQATEAGCGGAIEYTYTAKTTQVPEPGALALVGIALAGLAMARRKA